MSEEDPQSGTDNLIYAASILGGSMILSWIIGHFELIPQIPDDFRWLGIYLILLLIGIYYSSSGDMQGRSRFEGRSVDTTWALGIGVATLLSATIAGYAYQQGAPLAGLGYSAGLVFSFIGFVLGIVIILGFLGALVGGTEGAGWGIALSPVVGAPLFYSMGAPEDLPDPNWFPPAMEYSGLLNFSTGMILLSAFLIAWAGTAYWLSVRPVTDRVDHGYATIPALWPGLFVIATYFVLAGLYQGILPVSSGFLLPAVMVGAYEVRIQMANRRADGQRNRSQESGIVERIRAALPIGESASPNSDPDSSERSTTTEKPPVYDESAPEDPDPELLARVDQFLEKFANTGQPIEDELSADRYLPKSLKLYYSGHLSDLNKTCQSLLSDLSRYKETEETEALRETAQQLENLRNKVHTHNSAFVERKRDEYQDLFTDIDEAGHDLNEDQQRAIVRNDQYNQVIAGAGTGKTVVLTHRIAYLTEEGIEPDDIAAITLTKSATKEIEERLDDGFGIDNVDVSTIHSFAYNIASDARGNKPTTVDEEDLKNLIREEIREQTADPSSEFAYHYRKFLANYDMQEGPLEEEARQQRIQRRQEATYETLAGEEVESRAEKAIADYLFMHGVTYQHESLAEWAETAEDKNAYFPDFYLPEYDIYIEHWGLGENGEVAPWFSWSTEEYVDKLLWARDQFEDAEATLVETYDFEFSMDRLERALEHRLELHDVKLDQISFEELMNTVLPEYEDQESIVDDFESFISNACTFDTSPNEIEARLSKDDPRQYHFGQCGAQLLRVYQKWKDDNDLVDFDDMIYEAAEAVTDEPEEYAAQYDHLLVDEFQDVSISQIELLNSITDAEEGPRLFCVGDDWQSIYAFRGAVVDYFIEFEEYFGPAAITELRETYRCPETVLRASEELISNNPSQIEKDPEAASGRDTTPRVHPIDGDGWTYIDGVADYTLDLAQEYLERGSDPEDIMILGRYDMGGPYTYEIRELFRDENIPFNGKDDAYRPDEGEWADATEGVKIFSAHQAKGREAPHVILLHAAEGEDGFSKDVQNDDLLNVVRDNPANTEYEERRLFYVALTRVEETLDILTQVGSESDFLEEIDSYVEEVSGLADCGDLGDVVTLEARVDTIWEDTHESQEYAGLLGDVTGRKRFVAWENVNPPEVEEGCLYEFEGLKVKEYNDRTELHFTPETEVRESD